MVAWHQDSAYISANFLPEADHSATVWIALDDAGPYINIPYIYIGYIYRVYIYTHTQSYLYIYVYYI